MSGKQAKLILIPNSFQTPNAYSDDLFHLLTEPEMRCIVYAIRRIFGFGLREAPISVAQFVHGTKSKKTGEYLDNGTGLCAEAVVKALRSLKVFRVMIEIEPSRGRRATVWGLQLDYDRIDWSALQSRQDDVQEADRAKLEKAKQQADNSNVAGSGSSDSVLSHRTQSEDDSVLSHRTQEELAFCPTEHKAFCGTERKQHTRKPRETKNNGKPSNAATEVAAFDPTLLAKEGNLEALLEGLSGIKSKPFRIYVAVGYLLGVPDPQKWGGKQKELAAARRMLAKGYTLEQVARCVQYHLSIPFWKNNTSMGLAVMQSKIDAWIALGEPGRFDATSQQVSTTGAGAKKGRRRDDVNSRLDEWIESGQADGL